LNVEIIEVIRSLIDSNAECCTRSSIRGGTAGSPQEIDSASEIICYGLIQVGIVIELRVITNRGIANGGRVLVHIPLAVEDREVGRQIQHWEGTSELLLATGDLKVVYFP